MSEALRQRQTAIAVSTKGRGLEEITRSVARFVAETGLASGLLTIFCQHTSASLLIQENADQSVRHDLEAWFAQAAPEQAGRYSHEAEGPDDMPAHIRSALTPTSLVIPIENGKLALGTWQGVYLFEHRAAPHRRRLVLHAIGA